MKTHNRFPWQICLLLTTSLLIHACKIEDINKSNQPVDVRPLTSAEDRIVNGSNEFAFRIFSRLSQAEGSNNVFISPLSISSALTMAYNGSNTETKEAFEKTLNMELQSEEEINQSYQSLYKLLVGIDPQVKFQSANSLWSNNNFTLQPPFVSTCQTFFDARVQSLNFADPNAKNTINNWVNEKTNGRIESIVDEVRPEHLLFLINAIHFKGTWTYQFDPRKTVDGSFKLENGGEVTTKFMALEKARYRLYQDATKQLVELPYGNGQFSMVLLVPQDQQKVAQLVDEMSSANLNQWLIQADSTSLDLYLPKFTFAYEKTLNDILIDMGLGEAFGSHADFSRMMAGLEKGDARISKVKHKAFVEVNEEGTKAAAATSVEIVLTISNPPRFIRLDRPFVFLIREKATNTLLFAGKLMTP
jgi:serpin B